MTLNILFFTVTIKKRNMSIEEALRDQQAREAYEMAKTRAVTVHRLF
ncbi:YrzI family small protein [Robertmurraya massiliosenegalensis]